MITKYDLIVVTADEPYSGMSHTQILYTNFLSKQKTVLYLEPPHKWRPWNLLKTLASPKQISVQLFVHTYINVLPSKLKLGKAFNERINELIISRFLKKIRAQNTLIWHFDSYRSVLNGEAIKKQTHLQHLYHVIDPYYNNPVDAVLRQISNPIVITSPRNSRFYDNVSDKIINVPQCIDLATEKRYLEGPSFTKELPDKFLVLLGTISDDTNFDLLLNIAEAQLPLVIIGKKVPFKKKQNLFDALLSHQNIRYFGFLPPQEFYPILKKATAGLIAYDLSIRSRSFSPLKAINYLIAGLPIISNCNTELSELQGLAVYETAEQKVYLQYCKQALPGLAIDLPKVDDYLNNISLEAAVSRILGMAK